MKPRSSTATTTSNGAEVLDDPCWGDPHHCSLEYLLSLLSRSKTILYESKDFILMHKPADLRMDGAYAATVHKLITYWYPPPSLRNYDTNELLLAQLKDKHRHSDVKDNEWRPCHQLDYATSGVLLLAQNSVAAKHACTCFENRLVDKTYMAVLHGHIKLGGKDEETKRRATATTPSAPILPLSTLTTDLPVICPQRLQSFVQDQEAQYRRLKQRRRSDTFQGYQPPNAFLQIFQGRFARHQGTAIRKRKRNEKLSDDQWRQVEQALQLDESDQARVAQLSWKQLQRGSKKEPHLKKAIERATECYNKLLREILANNHPKDQADTADNKPSDYDNQELPTVFRVQGEEDQNSFYVYLAMAQVADEFAMRIPASHHSADKTWLLSGDETTMNFKVALTKCTIIQHAMLQGEPVTKVQLEPRTGRRHQLRVHTAFVGHPIVGDQTYECHAATATGETPTNYNKSPLGLSPRMCLHAFSLGLPLPEQGSPADGDLIQLPADMSTKQGAGKRLFATAPDPFSISKDGELTISNMC